MRLRLDNPEELPTQPPDDHDVLVFMRIDGCPEVPIGSARTVDHLPELLEAVADRLTRGIVEGAQQGAALADGWMPFEQEQIDDEL